MYLYIYTYFKRRDHVAALFQAIICIPDGFILWCRKSRLAKSIGGYKEEHHPVGYQKPQKMSVNVDVRATRLTQKVKLVGVAKLIRCKASRWWYWMWHWHYHDRYYGAYMEGHTLSSNGLKRLVKTGGWNSLIISLIIIVRSSSSNQNRFCSNLPRLI